MYSLDASLIQSTPSVKGMTFLREWEACKGATAKEPSRDLLEHFLSLRYARDSSRLTLQHLAQRLVFLLGDIARRIPPAKSRERLIFRSSTQGTTAQKAPPTGPRSGHLPYPGS